MKIAFEIWVNACGKKDELCRPKRLVNVLFTLNYREWLFTFERPYKELRTGYSLWKQVI